MNEIKDIQGHGYRWISYNGMNITNQCSFTESGNIIFPDWVAKEMNEGLKEANRRKKFKNRVLRFFGLYKSKYEESYFITIRDMP